MRFTLKTFLIVVAGFAVILGVFVQRATVQQRAVRHICEFGGVVSYGDEYLSLPTESDNSLAKNLIHSVTYTMISRGDYPTLCGDLKLLPHLKRIAVHGDGIIGAAEIQIDFPHQEIVDVNVVMHGLLGRDGPLRLD